uniref:Uncharacterized protein n=2 Tax=Triticeae TaxID=147389 RepID=A0A453MB30_AEGTS
PTRGFSPRGTHADQRNRATRVSALQHPGGEEEKAAEMAVMDTAFKALTAGLGVATLYLAGSFSFNVYRGLAWHSEQSKLEKEKEKSED